MKILIFINSLGAGGAERSMVELAKFLTNKDDVFVIFVCLERRCIGLEEEVEKCGIETIFFNRVNANWLEKVRFFKKVIKEEEPEIVHSVLAESNLILRLSRLFLKRGKIVQSLVNTPYSKERKKDGNLSWRKFLLAKQRDKWTARLTANIFYHAITKEVLEHYRPMFNIKLNSRVIYRGRYENNNRKVIQSGQGLRLINVGRQEFAKGQIDILKALVFIKDEFGISDINLEIYGRSGTSSAELEKFITHHSIEMQVKIEGFVSDVDKRLVNNDVFVFPSYYEGLGGALIEAFAAKLPCVCSDIPVLREVVGDEKGALFSPPGDYKLLAHNILKLYNDKNLREEMGNYSFSRFKEAFQMEKINGEMFSMYKQLLTGKI